MIISDLMKQFINDLLHHDKGPFTGYIDCFEPIFVSHGKNRISTWPKRKNLRSCKNHCHTVPSITCTSKRMEDKYEINITEKNTMKMKKRFTNIISQKGNTWREKTINFISNYCIIDNGITNSLLSKRKLLINNSNVEPPKKKLPNISSFDTNLGNNNYRLYNNTSLNLRSSSDILSMVLLNSNEKIYTKCYISNKVVLSTKNDLYIIDNNNDIIQKNISNGGYIRKIIPYGLGFLACSNNTIYRVSNIYLSTINLEILIAKDKGNIKDFLIDKENNVLYIIENNTLQLYYLIKAEGEINFTCNGAISRVKTISYDSKNFV